MERHEHRPTLRWPYTEAHAFLQIIGALPCFIYEHHINGAREVVEVLWSPIMDIMWPTNLIIALALPY